MLPALLLFLTVTINTRPVSCMVDTGAPVSVLSATQAAQLPGLVAVAGPGITLTGVNGTPYTAPVVQADYAATEDLTWQRPTFAVLPDAMLPQRTCLLGMDLLRRHPLVFDWDTGRVRALPDAHPPTPLVPLPGPTPVPTSTPPIPTVVPPAATEGTEGTDAAGMGVPDSGLAGGDDGVDAAGEAAGPDAEVETHIGR